MARLTEEMVIARSRQSDLSTVKKLNCWGSDLSDVSIIKRMRGVEVLALSVNKINGLQDFENCICLQELYLRKNNIQDLSELVYLQQLPHLKYLWLEENPCVDNAGPNYRSIVLRALPNLKKLDNIDVSPEEVAEAVRAAPVVEETYEEPPYQEQSNQQQYRTSPVRDPIRHSPVNAEIEGISSSIDRVSVPSSPMQRSPPIQDSYSPSEPNHSASPRHQRSHRNSYHQQYDQRSPASDQDSPLVGYRDRVPIAPSMSTHSMKEYYQSDYQKQQPPSHYRHSQTDLTEWNENHDNHNGSGRDHPQHQQQQSHRRPPAGDRDVPYRNTNGGSRDHDWEEGDRPRRENGRRSDGRFSDSASVVSNAVLNHYASMHRRPINRNSNLLSATLCLVKELDYPSLEVVEHAVRCRIDELATE